MVRPESMAPLHCSIYSYSPSCKVPVSIAFPVRSMLRGLRAVRRPVTGSS